MDIAPASWVSVVWAIGDRGAVELLNVDSSGLVCAQSGCARLARSVGVVLRRPMIEICDVCDATVLSYWL